MQGCGKLERQGHNDVAKCGEKYYGAVWYCRKCLLQQRDYLLTTMRTIADLRNMGKIEPEVIAFVAVACVTGDSNAAKRRVAPAGQAPCCWDADQIVPPQGEAS